MDWKNWLEKNKRWILFGIVGVQIVLIVVQIWLREAIAPADSNSDISSLIATNEGLSSELEEEVIDVEEYFEQPWIVDIKGAILKAGIYEVDKTMRVYDVIQLAGGLAENADTASLNFSQHLEDQMMIYIPTTDESDHREPIAKGPEKDSEIIDGLININTADVTMFMQLNGIGEKKAELIVQYREENGPFQSVDELMNISGIGQKTFESLQDKVTVSK